MSGKQNILGCFVMAPAVVYGASDEEKRTAKEHGDLFRTYIYGDAGISKIIASLNYADYGQDLILVLFQFYVKPIPYLLQNLKEIDNYRKNEKSIGIPIVVTEAAFFDQTHQNRFRFLKRAILEKMPLLAEVVKKKKLDTNIGLLTADIERVMAVLD